MVRFLFIVLFAICSCEVSAQINDSMFVVRKHGNWAIKYTARPGETLQMLAKRFSIEDKQLEYANDAETIKRFAPGTVLNIPITPENYYVQKQTFVDQHEIYYRVTQTDDISTISTYAGVTKQQIRAWNNMKGNSVLPDQVLFVGWVKYVFRDTSNPATDAAYPPIIRKVASADTGKLKVVGGLDTVYNRQTSSGTNIITEKGTAVFFDQPGKVKVYFAFHNATPKGQVIKVTNPGTGKSTYVKVVGPLPDTKNYANSIIGICSAAKEALGVTDSKAWCELSYSPN